MLVGVVVLVLALRVVVEVLMSGTVDECAELVVVADESEVR